MALREHRVSVSTERRGRHALCGKPNQRSDERHSVCLSSGGQLSDDPTRDSEGGTYRHRTQ